MVSFQESQEEEPHGIFSLIRLISVVLTLAVLVILTLQWSKNWISQGGLLRTVSGNSMIPTLQDGQLLYTDGKDSISRLDLVCLSAPEAAEEFTGVHSGDLLVKRIIGLPGEHVRIDSGSRIYIDEDYLLEPYLMAEAVESSYVEPLYDRIMEITLGPDEYFVLGDNRGDSLDSRAFGPVKEGEIRTPVSTSLTKTVVRDFLKLFFILAGTPVVFLWMLPGAVNKAVLFFLRRQQA